MSARLTECAICGNFEASVKCNDCCDTPHENVPTKDDNSTRCKECCPSGHGAFISLPTEDK